MPLIVPERISVNSRTDNKPAGVSRLLKDRSAWTLVLTCIFVAILGMLRQKDITGMEPDAFWAMKSEWRNQADIILLGDSRTLVGVSPETMQETLPDARILNYSFGPVSYSESYLLKVDELLDETSAYPTVVLGVTPLTLTPSSVYNNGFLAFIVEGEISRLGSSFAMLRGFFMPITTRELINTLGPADKAHHRYRRYHRTGWLEAYDTPEDYSESMAFYASQFRSNERGLPRQDVMDHLFDTVSGWTARGIRVYGFRPPTCEPMLAMEEAVTYWDPKEFGRRFEEAGGRWLTFDEDDYHSYDASHIDVKSAKLLSSNIAARIAADRIGGD